MKKVFYLTLIIGSLLQTKGYAADKGDLGGCNGYAENCQVGWILNHDGTCSENKVNGKTPIGVIFYIDDVMSGKCGYAITPSPIAQVAFKTHYKPNTGLFTAETVTEASWQSQSCTATRIILNKGDSSQYPAAWAAYEYAPSAVPTTKGKWCLPAAGLLNMICRNLETVNKTIKKLGGIELVDVNSERVWSSVAGDDDDNAAWTLFSYGNSNDCKIDTENAHSSYINTVRPVITF